MYNNICRISVYRKYKVQRASDNTKADSVSHAAAYHDWTDRVSTLIRNDHCILFSFFPRIKLSRQHDPFSAIVPEEEAQGGVSAETASPWLVEISSSFVSQENVNSMSDEINVVRNLLTGSVSFF